MILERGDMFSIWGKTDMFLFTANPIINKQGLAVMGRGIALQLAERVPTIRRDFAERMRLLAEFWGPCNCDIIDRYDDQSVGFFMVKDHWKNQARLDIIERSCKELDSWIMDDAMDRVDLNFPGIGNGKLKRGDVLPIIEKLPDNVHVWEYET